MRRFRSFIDYAQKHSQSFSEDCECGEEKQTANHGISVCSIHRTSRGMRGLWMTVSEAAYASSRLAPDRTAQQSGMVQGQDCSTFKDVYILSGEGGWPNERAATCRGTTWR